ncbi:Fmp41p [Saccharomyces cerevisiae YJM1248]|nr:Fmp41p [Saccharomyces cerevisiae YJM195]AJT08314.1 Fmp41p [Saccharomyces cerevisiae YJM627]AJT17356.1 Fmp41p [Saccharomyces cerevisiae YJM1248]AJT28845.1 Fmp41p [Saccharomyces cerevisiae YJM1439]CAD6487155.1 Y55_G0011000.mRNA.1.CDS.1 [Saccharomyces cerevisiae]
MSYNYLKAARKVICIGRNYAAHIKELNNSTPKQPFFFLKPTSSIVTPLSSSLVKTTRPANSTFNGLNEDGTNPGPIFIPRGVKVHHEIELALIVSKHLSNVTKMKPEEVYDSISGVALALDLTARNVQDEAKKKGLPWTISKGFDTFMPISAIVSREKFSSYKSNLQDIFRVKCSVNGQLRQDGGTNLMLHPLHKILQHISTMISLEPGDIILTGTPAGVGELKPGDHVHCELLQNNDNIVDMNFECENRPGPYEFRET